MVLIFAGKLPYANYRFASRAMTCENVSLSALSTDVGTKSSGDDLPDIDDNMGSTSSGETVVKSLRVGPVCGESDISGSGTTAPSATAIRFLMSRTLFVKKDATVSLNA